MPSSTVSPQRRYCLPRGRPKQGVWQRNCGWWDLARNNPTAFLKSATVDQSTATRQQIGFAAQRLAVRKPATAWKEWQRLSPDFSFDAATELSVARTVALWATRRQVDRLDELLAELPGGAIGTEVLTW